MTAHTILLVFDGPKTTGCKERGLTKKNAITERSPYTPALLRRYALDHDRGVVRHGTRDSADVWTLLRLGGNHRGSSIEKNVQVFFMDIWTNRSERSELCRSFAEGLKKKQETTFFFRDQQ